VSRSVLVAVVDEDAGAAAHGPASDGRRAREVPQACARRREGNGLRTTPNARRGYAHSWFRSGSANETRECRPRRFDGVPEEARSAASVRRHGGRAPETLYLPLEIGLSLVAKHPERLIHLGSELRRQRLTDTQIPAKRGARYRRLRPARLDRASVAACGRQDASRSPERALVAERFQRVGRALELVDEPSPLGRLGRE
jgi:hypothetical protein